jgi:hypothetical protein
MQFIKYILAMLPFAASAQFDTVKIEAHVYADSASATLARDTCDRAYNIPYGVYYITQHAVQAEKHPDGFWYIRPSEYTNPLLTEPQTITIISQ